MLSVGPRRPVRLRGTSALRHPAERLDTHGVSSLCGEFSDPLALEDGPRIHP